MHVAKSSHTRLIILNLIPLYSRYYASNSKKLALGFISKPGKFTQGCVVESHYIIFNSSAVQKSWKSGSHKLWILWLYASYHPPPNPYPTLENVHHHLFKKNKSKEILHLCCDFFCLKIALLWVVDLGTFRGSMCMYIIDIRNLLSQEYTTSTLYVI